VAEYYRNIDLPKPTPIHIQSVSNWMDGNKPLTRTESTFLQDWEDLRCPKAVYDRAGWEDFIHFCAGGLGKLGFGKVRLLGGYNWV
jgi:hypothetical protein